MPVPMTIVKDGQAPIRAKPRGSQVRRYGSVDCVDSGAGGMPVLHRLWVHPSRPVVGSLMVCLMSIASASRRDLIVPKGRTH
jgi:hypothetical protein